MNYGELVEVVVGLITSKLVVKKVVEVVVIQKTIPPQLVRVVITWLRLEQVVLVVRLMEVLELLVVILTSLVQQPYWPRVAVEELELLGTQSEQVVRLQVELETRNILVETGD